MIQLSAYAGITEWGHLYIYITEKVYEVWEDARAKILVALEARDQ